VQVLRFAVESLQGHSFLSTFAGMRDDKRCLTKLCPQSARVAVREVHAAIRLASLKAYRQHADHLKSLPSKRIDGTLVDHVVNVKAAKK
jgi:hypothetical protein